MNYIDVTCLCDELTPDEINTVGDGRTWERLITQACIKIDEVTFNRIRGVGFDNLTPFQQDLIKKAVCYQAKYIFENGYGEGDISSYSVGDISISVKEKASVAEKLDLDSLTHSLLKQTGLMHRQC